ncbi:MAG: hypothetical protein RL748_4346 [Pseudomonadota bacterium]
MAGLDHGFNRYFIFTRAKVNFADIDISRVRRAVIGMVYAVANFDCPYELVCFNIGHGKVSCAIFPPIKIGFSILLVAQTLVF